MSKEAASAPIGFSAAPPPTAPPSYSQAVGGVQPQAPYYPQQQPFIQKQPGVGQPPPTIVTTVVPLAKGSTHMVCPHCHAEVNTTIKTSPSNMAYLSSLLICLLGCPLGCCLIPFCMDDCMDTEHNCPSCKTYMGKYTR